MRQESYSSGPPYMPAYNAKNVHSKTAKWCHSRIRSLSCSWKVKNSGNEHLLQMQSIQYRTYFIYFHTFQIIASLQKLNIYSWLKQNRGKQQDKKRLIKKALIVLFRTLVFFWYYLLSSKGTANTWRPMHLGPVGKSYLFQKWNTWLCLLAKVSTQHWRSDQSIICPNSRDLRKNNSAISIMSLELSLPIPSFIFND